LNELRKTLLLAGAMLAISSATWLLEWLTGCLRFLTSLTLGSDLAATAGIAGTLVGGAAVFVYARMTRRWGRLGIMATLSALLGLACASVWVAPWQLAAVLVGAVCIPVALITRSHLWAITSDTRSPGVALRRLGIAAAAVALGPYLARIATRSIHWGRGGLLIGVFAGALFVVALLVVWVVQVGDRRADRSVAPDPDTPPGGRNGLSLVLRDSYLRLVAGWVVMTAIAGTLSTRVRDAVWAAAQHEGATDVDWGFRHRTIAVLVVVLVQLFIASRLARRGAMVAALIMWSVVLATCQVALVLAPHATTAELVYWPVTVADAMNVVATLALFLVVSRNESYDGRLAIVMVAHPVGVAIGEGARFGLSLLGAEERVVGMANTGVLAVTAVLALVVGRRFARALSVAAVPKAASAISATPQPGLR